MSFAAARNSPMTHEDVEAAVRAIIGHHGYQLEPSAITDTTVIARDAKIDGIDTCEFATELSVTFGDLVWMISWKRFSDQSTSFYGCATLVAPFWMLWRLISWPLHGEFIPAPNGGAEDMTFKHLCDVLEQGQWFEP